MAHEHSWAQPIFGGSVAITYCTEKECDFVRILAWDEETKKTKEIITEVPESEERIKQYKEMTEKMKKLRASMLEAAEMSFNKVVRDAFTGEKI